MITPVLTHQERNVFPDSLKCSFIPAGIQENLAGGIGPRRSVSEELNLCRNLSDVNCPDINSGIVVGYAYRAEDMFNLQAAVEMCVLILIENSRVLRGKEFVIAIYIVLVGEEQVLPGNLFVFLAECEKLSVQGIVLF